MKKLLSLMLVLMLALTCTSLVAGAAGEHYTFTYADGYFTITSGLDAMGGRIALRLETAKVQPLSVIVTGTGKNQKTTYELTTPETSAEVWGELNYSVAASYYATDDKYTYIGVDWYDTANVAAGSEIAYLNVQIDDETALDSASIVADFEITSDFISEANGLYGCVCGKGVTETQPVVLTYPNSDKVVGGGDEPEEEVFGIVKTESAVAGTDTMKDENGADVAAAGDKVVAIFAKNISDAELAAGSYGIVFGGVRYAGQLAVPAKTAWAIKLVGSAEQLPAGSYAYGVFAGDATVDATTPWVID